MSKIKHILSVIHYIICGAVCFQFTHFLVMIERIYILCLIIIIKSDKWTITHCLGLGHETLVCAVCLSIFLWCISIVAFKTMPQSTVDSPYKCQRRGALIFSLISARTTVSKQSRRRDLRRHPIHYDATVMPHFSINCVQAAASRPYAVMTPNPV